MSNSLIQIKNEFQNIKANPPFGFGLDVGLPEGDYYHWISTMMGPQDTPYRGGIFWIDIRFPKDYPEHAPEVKFLTPIYHINVKHTNTGSEPLGHICMNTLGQWNKTYSISRVLQEVYALMYLGNEQSPYGLDRQKEFTHNKALYDEKATYFTKMYANANQTGGQQFSEWNFNYQQQQQPQQ